MVQQPPRLYPKAVLVFFVNSWLMGIPEVVPQNSERLRVSITLRLGPAPLNGAIKTVKCHRNTFKLDDLPDTFPSSRQLRD